MIHLDTPHELVEYICDCGCLQITIEFRGQIQNRTYRCNGCGASVTTTDLLTQEHPDVLNSELAAKSLQATQRVVPSVVAGV